MLPTRRDKFEIRIAVCCVSLAIVLWALAIVFLKRPTR